MGMGTKKQYLTLAGVPLLGYALKTMEDSPTVQEIVVVVGPVRKITVATLWSRSLA
ncbi:MAG: 2-C-methyl-D-erythritol 4-phosphate cytidylyltransferase [Candidatus Syntrophopropionicum ammoniitolerans]